MMSDINSKEHSFMGVNQLSFRSLLLGFLGSSIITASSMYVALRMGALPWPTIFVAVLSMALLKILGNTTLNEINITQTAMSAGAMVAGGIAFTLPGLWITGLWKNEVFWNNNFWKALAIAFAGMLLGTVLTWLLRPRFIETEKLPYPIGVAAAETIILGDKGGKKSILLFGTMAFSAIFTYIRDYLGWIPSAIYSKWLYAKNIQIGLWVSPMAAGIGYMIGPLYTGVWFLGAVISYLLIIPLGPALGIFPSLEYAVNFKNAAGIGLMVGTGIGILVSYVINIVKKASKNDKISNPIKVDKKHKSYTRVILLILPVAIAFVLSIYTGLSPIASLLLMAGVFAASAMAATITGETGINPMEIFGIIILVVIRLVVNVDATGAFIIAACVAVACGYAGDLLNDYKAGHILGTNPLAQLIAQLVGGVAGAIISTAALFAIINQYGGVDPEKGLVAAQAFVVSQMVNGISLPIVFAFAAILGGVLYLLKVPVMTLGIGLYLPFSISSIVFLGGVIRFFVDRIAPKSVDDGNVTASGMLGGEGITGVTVAIVKMLTGG